MASVAVAKGALRLKDIYDSYFEITPAETPERLTPAESPERLRPQAPPEPLTPA